MKLTPVGLKTDKFRIFFTKKIDFCLMPTRNQNLQWAGGGGGGGYSAQWVQTDIKNEFGMPKKRGLAPGITLPGPRGEKHIFRGGEGGGGCQNSVS